ncbi:MAG: dihydrodipicolinate synthase family protein [Castellaniella sp.]|uniref:dihydrodipicolinate synthase family protein n=1 Tax=Castellaniella sp. TaxID=1955812 RepID=UPI003C70CAE4
MRKNSGLQGVYSPVVTPFDATLEPDSWLFVRHCRWLVEQGVGLAVFGTNSEANSMSVGEKIDLLDALLDAGIPAARLLPGTGCCALPDSVRLTHHAVNHGTPAVLMLPPFFYKNVSDDGLFANYAELIQRVADDRLRIYLYHIPQVSQVGFSLSLIERLLAAYPQTIAGVKDSSGDWDNTQAMITEFAADGFSVFAGSEPFLLQTMRAGGAGCITATGNVNPAAIVRLHQSWQDEDADMQQSALNAVRGIFQEFPMIPALKAAIAHYGASPDWVRVRPPLTALSQTQQHSLVERLAAHGFSMPGL